MIILTDDNALQEIPEIPFKFIQSFPLDPFQKNAITCIAKNENVLKKKKKKKKKKNLLFTN